MENVNSCCFVAKISELKPIEGADMIEMAIIEGWNCITQKGNYKSGDLVGCATTDAVIPEELAEKMNVTGYLRKGNRVRTVKLRGVYSECLIIPMSYVPNSQSFKEGSDLMKALGVFKYEPPVKNIQLTSGKKIRYHENPNFLVYYKFPNIKNVPGMFTKEDEVQITRKLHGTNARYGIVKKTKLSFLDRIKKFLYKYVNHTPESWKFVDYDFVVGSHNVEKGSDSQGFYDTNVWFDVAKKYSLKEKLWNYVMLLEDEGLLGSGFVIYGEIYGPGIQANYDYGLKEIEFAVFDTWFNGEYLDVYDTAFIVDFILNLPLVPVLYTGPWSQEVQDKFLLNNFVEGTKVPHEGIVIKHISGAREKVAKVINPQYAVFSEKNNVGDSH